MRRSHRSGLLETFLLPLLLHRPFHCKSCGRRYYAFSLGRKTVARVTLTLAGTVMLVLVAVGILSGQLWALSLAALRTMARLLGNPR